MWVRSRAVMRATTAFSTTIARPRDRRISISQHNRRLHAKITQRHTKGSKLHFKGNGPWHRAQISHGFAGFVGGARVASPSRAVSGACWKN